MDRSIGIGTYAGIPVKIHWTFWFLILFVVYNAYTNSLDLLTSLSFLLYILILFLCVTMHEYGHALMARKFGVHTGEILLTPIGGIAKMGHMSTKPKDELLISIAGPLVNVGLSLLLGFIIYFFLGAEFFPKGEDYEIFRNVPDMIRLVFLMNIVLFLFNLIPAYPMDGGRVLRALIGFRTNFERATIIATSIGMGIALLFLSIAIYLSHPTLGFIGVFIFFMANGERRVAVKNAKLTKPILPYVNKDFTKIYNDQLMSELYPIIHNAAILEKDFLVFNKEEQIIGSLPEQYILEAEKMQEPELQIKEFMSSNYGIFEGNTSIIDLANTMNAKAYYVVAIQSDENIIGTVDRKIINKIFGRK